MEENKGTNSMAADLDHALRKKTFLREARIENRRRHKLKTSGQEKFVDKNSLKNMSIYLKRYMSFCQCQLTNH